MTNQQNGMCTQRRLRSAWASAQSDQSSLSAWRKLWSLATHWAHSEDSDQTGRMSRLIGVFAPAHMPFCWFCHEAAQMWQQLQCERRTLLRLRHFFLIVSSKWFVSTVFKAPLFFFFFFFFSQKHLGQKTPIMQFFVVYAYEFLSLGQVMRKWVLSHMRTTKAQMRGCAGWSAPLLFAA